MKLLKPAPRTIIRNPERDGAIVPPEGVIVDERRPFWQRRLLEGSMTAEDVPPVAGNVSSRLSSTITED